MWQQCLLMTALFVSAATRLAGQEAPRQFWFDDPRPLAQATIALEHTYGWIVTYEDVPVMGADAKDVTAEVRKDHDANAKTRIIVPNGKPFAFTVDDRQARQPAQMGAGAVIASLLDAYHRSGNPGRFRALVARAGGRLVFHVVPFESRDVQGQSIAYRSPLDARISVPRARRPLGTLLALIGEKIEEVSGVRVATTTALASNYFIQTEVEEGAQDEIARDVLRRVLIEDTGQAFSWTMRCQQGFGCSLNPHLVGKDVNSSAGLEERW
jgi:hypothetical protein